MVPLPDIDRLLALLGDAVDFASDHPFHAVAVIAGYVWLLLGLLEPVERR